MPQNTLPELRPRRLFWLVRNCEGQAGQPQTSLWKCQLHTDSIPLAVQCQPWPPSLLKVERLGALSLFYCIVRPEARFLCLLGRTGTKVTLGGFLKGCPQVRFWGCSTVVCLAWLGPGFSLQYSSIPNTHRIKSTGKMIGPAGVEWHRKGSWRGCRAMAGQCSL